MDPNRMIPVYNPHVPPPNFTVQGPAVIPVQLQPSQPMGLPPPPPPTLLPAQVGMPLSGSMTHVPPPTTLASRPLSYSEGYVQFVKAHTQSYVFMSCF